MSLSFPMRTLERFISFGGICGVIGVVCDLLTPVGNYTLWALFGGAIILMAGLVLLSTRRWPEVAKATSGFGVLLVTISLGFMAFAPENDRGVLASEFAFVGKAQSDLLGIREAAEAIAVNTAEIAGNTSDIAVSTSDIAVSNNAISANTSDIASDAELVRHLSFSMDGFLTALHSQDQINIRAYCDRGYRLYQTAFLFKPDRSSPNQSDRNYDLLNQLQCFDAEQICDTTDWYGLTNSLDPRRVAEQCGAPGLQRIAQLEAEQEQAAIDRVTRQRDCEAKLIADFGEENGSRLSSACRPQF